MPTETGNKSLHEGGHKAGWSAHEHAVPLELSPLVLRIFKDGQQRYGAREFSPNIIRRLEDACDVKVLGEGFPAQITDQEPEERGYEVLARRGEPGA